MSPRTLSDHLLSYFIKTVDGSEPPTVFIKFSAYFRTLSILALVIRPNMFRLTFQQLLQSDLRLKAQLGFDTHTHQNIGIIIPTLDTIQITGAALVIDDEGDDAMPETFLEHDQPAYTPVTIFVRVDAFKLYMEIQYILKVNGFLRFVLLNQIRHRCANLGWRRSFAKLLRGDCFAIPDWRRSMATVLAAVTEQLCLQLINEGLS